MLIVGAPCSTEEMIHTVESGESMSLTRRAMQGPNQPNSQPIAANSSAERNC